MRADLVGVVGNFDSVLDLRDPKDWGHRVTVSDVAVKWVWSRGGVFWGEIVEIPAGTRWDGASRPEFVGWLVPRWGVFSLASLVHDVCFRDRPVLSDGTRMSRKHADLLFLAVMRSLSADRVAHGWKSGAQLWLADVMYRAVRWFGEAVWDRHDGEFSGA